MLNFGNLLDYRPLHNEHENVICTNKLFREKVYKKFLVKNETRATRKKIFLTIFSILIFFMYSLLKY